MRPSSHGWGNITRVIIHFVTLRGRQPALSTRLRYLLPSTLPLRRLTLWWCRPIRNSGLKRQKGGWGWLALEKTDELRTQCLTNRLTYVPRDACVSASSHCIRVAQATLSSLTYFPSRESTVPLLSTPRYMYVVTAVMSRWVSSNTRPAGKNEHHIQYTRLL